VSVIQSNTKAHNDAVTAAEGARQSGVAAAGSSQSAARAAEVTFYRAVVASCKANNNNSGLEAALSALQALQGSET
jgi:hypothetical protein